MGKIALTATKTGAQETKNVLSGIKVQTGKVFVGTADYQGAIPEDMVNITIGLFMDGTLNNRANTKARQAYDAAGQRPTAKDEDALKYKLLKAQESKKKKADRQIDSYDNDQTNIALLEPAYAEVTTGKHLKTKIYIEGIGTEDLEIDDADGFQKGTGDTGIPKKVEKAITKAVEQVGLLLEKNKVEAIHTLTFDVFGFSRGAAAARHFVSKLNGAVYAVQSTSASGRPSRTKKHISRFGALGKELQKQELPQPKFLQAGFAGLYDTVASYGLFHIYDTSQLDLDAVGKAKHVLHLVAEDEHRENFVLTNIKSAGPKGLEIQIPGVHSDIGGSYTDNYQEKNLVIKPGGGGFRKEKQANTYRDKLIADSWYRPHEIAIRQDLYPVDDRHQVVINKTIASKKYSYVSLHIMAEYAKKKKVEFKDSIIKDNYLLCESISISIKGKTYTTTLEDIKSRLTQYVNGTAKKMDFSDPADQKMLRAIRLNYVHSSAHYSGKVEIGGIWYPPYHPRDSYLTREREVNDG